MSRLASALLLPLIAAPILSLAQAVPAAERAALLATAKSRYYNLTAAGVTSFSCDVAVDWVGLFQSIGAAGMPADDPSLMYLQKTHVSFVDRLTGTPEFKWEAASDPPAEREKALAQVHSGLEMMLNGFLAAWNPTLNGTLIPSDPAVFTQTPTGYLIHESRNGQEATLNLDKDLVILHLSGLQTDEKTEMDTTFSPSPNGLVLTRVDSVVNTPPDAPPVKVTMTSLFAPVDGVQIPTSLAMMLQNKMKVDMTFSGCAVHRLADPVPAKPDAARPEASKPDTTKPEAATPEAATKTPAQPPATPL